MAEGHDLAAIGAGNDFGGRRARGYDQRVVTARHKRVRQIGEKARGIMMDGGGDAVHGFCCAGDDGAERLADALVAEANAEDRDFAGKSADNIERGACLVRAAGAGREDDRVRREACEFSGIDRVIAAHDDVLAQLAEGTGDVEDEGVVIVDNQDHGVQRIQYRAQGAQPSHVTGIFGQ